MSPESPAVAITALIALIAMSLVHPVVAKEARRHSPASRTASSQLPSHHVTRICSNRHHRHIARISSVRQQRRVSVVAVRTSNDHPGRSFLK
jgi:hypothetical protein